MFGATPEILAALERLEQGQAALRGELKELRDALEAGEGKPYRDVVEGLANLLSYDGRARE